ncbi:FtsW/RodA/SpoVE family cell cycle protein [Cryomorpha ignava]|uniref:Probable peptidoglycan glycosyltransferase FtsW n=2 Tax=Cryomorpha ignava TaxID=101383 RepID=A0A7K3WN65_9FLAO|nr:FtsW/RodA/SpoVE family cell cycle protein [Cryomorpha ignava]
MVCLILGLVSILAVYSSISSLAYKYTEGNTFYYLFKHGIMLITGFVIMYFVHKINYRYFSRLSQIAIWLAAILLILTLLLGVNLNDASRWIKIPLINQNFQTSDFAKIALIAYVARMLTLRKEFFHSFKEGLLPILIPIVIICGLILPANFSTAAMLFMVCVTLLFVGGIPFKHLVMVFAIAGAGFALLLVLSTSFPDLLPRVETWKTRLLSYESGDSEANYQVEHAMMAIQSGGVFPTGPGTGDSRNYLPHPYSDMIFAFIIEEYGTIIGGCGLLLLYLIFLYRALRLARKCERNFGSLLVIGMSFLIAFQAFINMGVAVSLLPVTGQPLPLVSMGGTSIWFTCIAVGMILSVSRSVYEGEKIPGVNRVKKKKDYAVA